MNNMNEEMIILMNKRECEFFDPYKFYLKLDKNSIMGKIIDNEYKKTTANNLGFIIPVNITDVVKRYNNSETCTDTFELKEYYSVDERYYLTIFSGNALNDESFLSIFKKYFDVYEVKPLKEIDFSGAHINYFEEKTVDDDYLDSCDEIGYITQFVLINRIQPPDDYE